MTHPVSTARLRALQKAKVTVLKKDVREFDRGGIARNCLCDLAGDHQEGWNP